MIEMIDPKSWTEVKNGHYELHCNRCDNIWYSKKKDPGTCVNKNCRSPYWNKIRQRDNSTPHHFSVPKETRENVKAEIRLNRIITFIEQELKNSYDQGYVDGNSNKNS
jgi:hypothetical protein